MMILHGIRSKLSEFRDETSGAATVEFILILPMLAWLIFSTFELGWLTTKQMMLTRAVNLTIRDLRLGKIDDPTHAKLKTLVCDRLLIVKDCSSSIHIELLELHLSSGVPSAAPACVDRTGEVEPAETFATGEAGDLMLVRVCVIVDPLLPGIGIGAQLTLDPSGGYSIVTYSAFKREP